MTRPPPPRPSSAPPSRINCKKLNKLSRRIRDEIDLRNDAYETRIAKDIKELEELAKVLSDIDPSILYDRHEGILFDSSDEDIVPTQPTPSSKCKTNLTFK